MASPLIQFRLKDDARQALEALALPGESLNICAQRLLMQALEMSTAVDRQLTDAVAVDKTVDKLNQPVDNTVDKESLIEELTPAITKQVRTQIEAGLGDLVNDLIDKNLPIALEAHLGKA